MAVEFGTGKTVLILATVVGCFAVLWPKLFYPMLLASLSQKPSLDSSQVCCDVIFETDVNAIKIVVEMCGSILHQYDDVDPRLTKAFEEGRLSKDVVQTCRNEVLSKCGVDITAFLEERVRLGHTYKQILDEIRSFNSSICLKKNFGVALGQLGAPRHMSMRVPKLPSHFRQERPPHIRPEMLHPALRERGRAISQAHIVPRIAEKESKPVPMAGIRPPMGGAGHVVPPPKGTGTMGIIMPIYTIGIVVFFMYTIMKVMFKKPSSGPGNYPEYSPDPEFRKLVFEDNTPITRSRPWKGSDEGTKLVATAISGLLAEVDQQRDWLARRAELELQSEKVAEEETQPTEQETQPTEQEASEEMFEKTSEGGAERTRDQAENSAQVQVVNMEFTASCEGGQRWSRPGTPVPCPVPPPPPSPSPEPLAIFLEGALPSQSQLLVADSETQAVLSDDEDAPVILSGKVTLSLIGLDHDKQGDEAPRTPTAADDLGRSFTDVGEPFDYEEEELLTSTPMPGTTEDSTGAVAEKPLEVAVLEACVAAEVSQAGDSLPATMALSLDTELSAIETSRDAHFLGEEGGDGGTQIIESAVLKEYMDVQDGQDASKDEVEKIMFQEELMGNEEVEYELEVVKEDVEEEQKFKEEEFEKELELDKEEVKEDCKLHVEEATGYEKIKDEEVALDKEKVKEEKEEAKADERKAEVKEEAKADERKAEVKEEAKADERKAEVKEEAKAVERKAEVKEEAKADERKAEVKEEVKAVERKAEVKEEVKAVERKAEVREGEVEKEIELEEEEEKGIELEEEEEKGIELEEEEEKEIELEEEEEKEIELEEEEEIEVEEEEVEVEKNVKKDEVDEGKVAQDDGKEEEVEEGDVVVPDARTQRQDDATVALSEEDSLQKAKETAREAVEYVEEEEEEEEIEEIEDEDEDEDDGTPPRLSSVPNCTDEAVTTTNYTTASGAAEATNATGPEETAADLSALESIDPDDDNDDLGDEEEVWNGDLDSDEEESEEEEGPYTAASAQPPHRQHDR